MRSAPSEKSATAVVVGRRLIAERGESKQQLEGISVELKVFLENLKFIKREKKMLRNVTLTCSAISFSLQTLFLFCEHYRCLLAPFSFGR